MPKSDTTGIPDASRRIQYILSRAILGRDPLAPGSETHRRASSDSFGAETYPTCLFEPEPTRRLFTLLVDTYNEAHPVSVASRWSSRLRELRRFRTYLSEAVRNGLISPALVREALTAWEVLSSATDNTLRIPNAAPAEGGLLMTWDADNHHLELEFVEGTAPPTLFYADRSGTEPAWELEVTSRTPLGQRAIRSLALFRDRTDG